MLYKKSLDQPRSHALIKWVSELHSKSRFSVTSRDGIFWDFWYVFKDTLQSRKPLKNLLLQLGTGWPIFCHKMTELLWICSLTLINKPSLSIKALSFYFGHHEKCRNLGPKLNWLTSGHDQDLGQWQAKLSTWICNDVIGSTNNIVSSNVVFAL